MKKNSFKTICENKRFLFALFSILISYSVAPLATAENIFNFKPFQTEIGESIFTLHNSLMAIIVVVFIGVFYFMFYSLIYHRKEREAKGYKQAHFHENLWVEIIWTIIPFIILVIMVIPTTKYLLEMRDNNSADFSIIVTGYQFKWGYEYLDGPAKGIKFISNITTTPEEIANVAEKKTDYLLDVDNPLILPEGKKAKLLITSNDVLHAFYVPELAVQQTAVPGFIREFSVKPLRAGTYRGQCTELCGSGHPFMPIVVKVLPEIEYNKWVSAKHDAKPKLDENKKYELAELKKIGEKVYQTNCVACHQAEGQGLPPAFPGLAKSAFVNGDKKTVLNIVTNGKAGTAMGAFGKQISELDVAAVVSYIRNNFGNSTGDVVQPSEVTEILKK